MARWMYGAAARACTISCIPLHCRSSFQRCIATQSCYVHSSSSSFPDSAMRTSSDAAIRASSNASMNVLPDAPTSAYSASPAPAETLAAAQVDDSIIPDASAMVASPDTFSWLPVSELCQCLHWLDDCAGIPLWAAMALSCLTLRAAFLPLLYVQQSNAARLAKVAPSLSFLRFLFTKDVDTPLMEKVQSYRKASWALRKKAGYSRLISWVFPIVQIPAFFTMVVSLRQVLAQDPAFATGGMLWFENLVAKDTTLALPGIAIALSYYNIELSSSRFGSRKTLMSRALGLYQTFLVLSFPFISQVPSGVFMYWIPSSLWSLAQTSILRSERVRSHFGFPKTSETLSPTDAITLDDSSKKIDQSQRSTQSVVEASSHEVVKNSSAT